MTSLQLLAWIVGGIALQIAIYLGISFSRHWGRYQDLRRVVEEGDGPLAPLSASPESSVPPAAWAGLRTLRVVNRGIEDGKGDICSFYLASDDGGPLPAFLPGQFLTFKLDLALPNGGVESIVRCYSLSDAPQANAYRVSIKRALAPRGSDLPAGRSSNYFHDHVHVGSLLQARAPAGHFYLDAGESPVVLIGGGIGITPLMSMLNWSMAAQPQREVWLFYGVRDGSELAMLRHLQDLAAARPNLQLHICFSDPKPGDMTGPARESVTRHHSRVTVALLRSLLPLKPYHYYLCGPTPMLQSLVPALEEWGVPDARIHFEAFGPASIPRKSAPPKTEAVPPGRDGVMVTFAKTGRQVAWTAGSGNLLDFAEAHGIAVNSGCRAGSCGSCQTSIRAGEVAYNQSPDFDPDPGSCLLCVTQPKTAVTLEA